MALPRGLKRIVLRQAFPIDRPDTQLIARLRRLERRIDI
jgi:hypothetical protein